MARSKNKQLTNEPLFERGCGNVFVDLGFPESEAINIVARLELMAKIEDIIKQQGLTQQEAAQILGLRQPRVSELMNSRSDKFTIDMLMKLLDRLGRRVEFVVTPKNAAA